MWCDVLSVLFQWVVSTPSPFSRSEDLHLRSTAPNSLQGGEHDYGPVIRVGPRRKELDLEEDEESCVTTLVLTSEQMDKLEPLKVQTVPLTSVDEPHSHSHSRPHPHPYSYGHPSASSRTSFNQQLVSIVASYSQPPSDSTAGRTFHDKPKPRLKTNFAEPVDKAEKNYGNIDQGPFLEQLRMVRMRRGEATKCALDSKISTDDEVLLSIPLVICLGHEFSQALYS